MKKFKKSSYRWTLTDLRTVALRYKTRSEFQRAYQGAYMAAYHMGALDFVCSHMKPSHKKNKFIVNSFNFGKVLPMLFSVNSLEEFRHAHRGAYNTLLRHKVNMVEFYENMDDASYVRNLVLQLSQDNTERLV